jgi:hypothetical protein
VATELLGLDLTPGFGVLQTLAFLIGLTVLTIAVYLSMSAGRPPDAPRSLQAGIGVRLSLTGLVFCYVTGFADLIRIGTHVQPEFERPFIGPLQLGGFVVGLLILVAGDGALLHQPRQAVVVVDGVYPQREEVKIGVRG